MTCVILLIYVIASTQNIFLFSMKVSLELQTPSINDKDHGLRTPNEGINQRYLKNWADVADKICCRHT